MALLHLAVEKIGWKKKYFFLDLHQNLYLFSEFLNKLKASITTPTPELMPEKRGFLKKLAKGE